MIVKLLVASNTTVVSTSFLFSSTIALQPAYKPLLDIQHELENLLVSTKQKYQWGIMVIFFIIDSKIVVSINIRIINNRYKLALLTYRPVGLYIPTDGD